jgi:hypothetical protein
MIAVEWASWVQAAIMIAAILIAPSTISALYGYLWARMEAECIPYFNGDAETSRFWEISLRKRAGQILDSRLTIYVLEPGNQIQEAVLITPNDSALSAKIDEDDHGCVDLHVKRVMSGRTLTVRVVLANEDVPFVYSHSGPIRRSLVIREGQLSEIKVRGPVFHHRLCVLLIQFALCTAIIVARLGYLAM